MKNKFKCFLCKKNFSVPKDELKNTDSEDKNFLYCDDCMKIYATNRWGLTIETYSYEILKYKPEDFDRCAEIYEHNFFRDTIGEKDKGVFDMSKKENQLFVMRINDEIIGFGGYQIFEDRVYMLRSEFDFRYNYNGGYKEKMDNYVLKKIKSIPEVKAISLYTSREIDVGHYKRMGFALYKDFATEDPELYENSFGEDIMRFAFDIHIE